VGFLSKLFTGRPEVLPTPISSLAEFRQTVLERDIPVIVDVWSPTCAPCKKLAPVLVEVATRYADRVGVVEINAAAAERALLNRLGVRATPTLIIYDGDEEFGRATGFRPRGWFDEMIAAEFPEA
jgi:thiol-disulfide isomerase/thioredoxin